MKKKLFIFFMLLMGIISYAQKVAVIGLNHSDPDGFSFVVLQDLPNGEVIYFTENEYDNVANVFNSITSEAIVKFTFSSAVTKGNVIHVAETSTSNTFTVSCTGGVCGTAVIVGTGPFAIGQGGEAFYAYSDTDDNPNNGLTTIHAVLYSGFSEGSIINIGGNIITSQDPTVDYPNAIVVDGFTTNTTVGYSHHRVQYTPTALARTDVTKVILENAINYEYTGAPAGTTVAQQALSNLLFTNFNVTSSDPIITVTATPLSVNEDSGTNLVYTFLLSTNATSNMTINFSVGGTATFSSDYSQSGADTFTATTGTVIIPSGSNSATVTVTPTGDTTLEPNETIILTVTSGSGYSAGTPSIASTTIVNDDSLTSNPFVAITGVSHELSQNKAFSFVALQDIPASSIIYFTDHSFSTATLSFSSETNDAIVAWTSPASVISKGQVIVVTQTVSGANTFAITCSSGQCGTVSVQGTFSFASVGETFYAYRDNDNNPYNGITQVDAAIYTGNSAIPSSGGAIPAIENPSGVYTQSIVISGFPTTAPLRTEYDATKRNVAVNGVTFTNLSNWVNGQTPATLSTVPFGNLNVLCLTPTTPTFTQVASICTGATLAALPTSSTNGFTGTWSPSLNNTTTTTYTFTPAISQCATTATMTITVNPRPVVSVSGTSTICVGATTTLSPTSGGTWASSNSAIALVTNAGLVTGVSGGTATFVFTSAAGCTSLATSAITINALPTAPIATAQSFCGSATVANLLPAPSATIRWYANAAGGSELATSTVLTTTTYHVAAVNANGCESASRTAVAVTFPSTTWNGTAWSNGVPTSITTAIFTGNFTAAANLTACSLAVSGTAVVTIPAGFNLTVNNEVTVAASATLNLENNANLIQINAATNTGNIIAKRNTLINRLDFTYWSSPVAGQNLLSFTPQTLPNRFYTYSEPTKLFVQVSSPSTTNFDTAKGYSLRAPNNFLDAPVAPQTFVGTFTGVPNNGNFTIPVTFTAGQGIGYNLIGNPYPSTVSGIAFLTANTGSMYFWTHSLLNAGVSNYAVYNLSGGTAATAGGPGVMPNGFIQTGQGFMFLTTSSKNVTFTNAMRQTNNANQFFRSAAAAQKDKIWLNLSNNGGAFSQTMIAYLPNTTTSFDDGYDAPQLNANGNVFYSQIADKNYAIQSRGNFDNTDVVKLNFNCITAGNYTISTANTEGVFSNAQVFFLKDNLLGITHNIKQIPYNFVATAGETTNRFEIVYQSVLSNNSNLFSAESVIVFENNKFLNITSTQDLKAVKVFDVQGRTIFETNAINAKSTVLTNFRPQQQVLLVQITSLDNQVVTKKVVF
jgi:hypothetical protein